MSCRKVECLERRDCKQNGCGLKHTRAILLCPWERHFTAHITRIGGLGKQFYISSYLFDKLKKKFNHTTISGLLGSELGRLLVPSIAPRTLFCKAGR